MPGVIAELHRERGSERIRRAAIALFRARGYHGTSVRELARTVRVEAASLYYHFPSKQEILRDIFTHVMNDLLDGLKRATESQASPEGRLRAAVRFHALFHVERQAEAFISHSELRSLSPPTLRAIIAKRDRYEAMLRAVLVDGVKDGVFQISDVPLTATAILTMCSGVADWFSRHGRLSADAVADAYADMVQQLVSGARPLPPPRRASAVRHISPSGPRGKTTRRWPEENPGRRSHGAASPPFRLPASTASRSRSASRRMRGRSPELDGRGSGHAVAARNVGLVTRRVAPSPSSRPRPGSPMF